MRFKLDENLGRRVAQILGEAGHDVSTVHEQQLQGATDATIYDVCRREQRRLVTVDLDFGNHCAPLGRHLSAHSPPWPDNY